MRASALAAVIILFNGMSCWARDFSRGDLSSVECGTTLYAWSGAPDKAPTEVATGTVADSADGQGNWTRGRLVLQVLTPQNAATKRPTCIYDLVRGDYTVNPDGSGTSHNWWKPEPHNDARCASLHLDGFAAGGTSSELKPQAGGAVQNFYLNDANTGYQVAVGPAGFATGTCKPGK